MLNNTLNILKNVISDMTSNERIMAISVYDKGKEKVAHSNKKDAKEAPSISASISGIRLRLLKRILKIWGLDHGIPEFVWDFC